MKKKYFITVILSFVFIFTVSLISQVKHTYTGVDECKRCHANDGIGNQYQRWLSNPHSKAYKTLSTGPAMEVAKRVNVAVPSEDAACLKCHTTGGGTAGITPEGVGCEACHGPGSAYHELSAHASFTDREAAYKRAISNGMYPVIGIEHIKYREKLCRRCHTQTRPCVPQDPQKAKEQQLALDSIANFVFRHPIRR